MLQRRNGYSGDSGKKTKQVFSLPLQIKGSEDLIEDEDFVFDNGIIYLLNLNKLLYHSSMDTSSLYVNTINVYVPNRYSFLNDNETFRIEKDSYGYPTVLIDTKEKAKSILKQKNYNKQLEILLNG